MNKRRALALNLIFVFLTGSLTLPGPPSAVAGPALSISASSAILFDTATQKIIYSKAPHVPRPPASTTKIMTALVVIDRLALDRVVQIPDWVSSIEPSKAYLHPGESYRVRDLLHATLISSANDAAEVLAAASAGSRAKFARWMNQKAQAIGCRNTRFTNASGLPSGSPVSTVYDLALIMQHAQKSAFIVDSLGRRTHTIQSLGGRKIPLRNHNRLLWKSAQPVIGKTGWTRKGRHCFVGRIRWKGREVLVSLLGSHRLWQDLNALVGYQFGVTLSKVGKNKRRWSSTETRGIQKALVRAGQAPGPVDGRFGSRTVRSIELFQKAHGLQIDGIVGPQTCRELTRYGLPRLYCR